MTSEVGAILGLVGMMLTANGLLGTALPIRMTDLGVSPASIAALGALSYGGGLIGAPLSSIGIGRLGTRRAFVVFAALFGLWLLAMVFTRDGLALQLQRLAAGVSFSALTVVVETQLNALAPTGRRSRLQALYMVVFYGAQATGAALAGFSPPDGRLALIAGAIVLILAAGAAALPGTLSAKRTNAGGFPRPRHLRLAPAGYVVGFMTGAMLGCFYGFAPVFAIQSLADSHLVGLFMAASMIGGIAGLLISGRLADRCGLANIALIWALLLASASIAMVFIPRIDDTAMVAASFVYGALLFSIYPFGSAMVNARLSAAERVPANALYIITIGFGGIVGPTLAIHIVSLTGNRAGFTVIAACASLVAAVVARRAVVRAPQRNVPCLP